MKKTIQFLLILYLCINSFSVNADLTIDSIYPTAFKPGQLEAFTITGKGFDEHTRISFFPDAGNNRAIIDSLDTPGICYSLSKSGHYIFIADGLKGLQVISVSENNKLSLQSTFDTPGSAMDIELIGNTAYIADGTAGLQIIDIQDPMNPELRQTINVSSEATGINISGTTLCLTTIDKGFFIFNISNHNLIELTGNYVSTGGKTGTGIACEAVLYKNYILTANENNDLAILDIKQIDHGPIHTVEVPGDIQSINFTNNLVLITKNMSNLYIYDFTNVMQPVMISSYDSQNIGDYIMVQDKNVYVSIRFNGVEKIDISKAEKPVHMASISTPGAARKLLADQDMIYVADHYGVQLIDTSKITSSGILSQINAQDGKFFSLEIKDTKAYINDRFDTSSYDRLQIIDISDPFNPEFISTTRIPSNIYDIAVHDRAAYVASNNELHIFDISQAEHPEFIKKFTFEQRIGDITIDNDRAYLGSIINSDNNATLHILDIQDSLSPKLLLSALPYGGTCNKLEIVNKVLYCSGTIKVPSENIFLNDLDYHGLIAINVNPLDHLKILDSIYIANPFNVSVKNSYAYVGDYHSIHIIDVSNPNDLSEENVIQTNDRPMNISLADQTACVALGHTGLLMLDTQKPMSPQIIGQLDLSGMVMDVKIHNNIAYAACHVAGLAVLSVPYEIKQKEMIDQSHISVSSFSYPAADGHYTIRVFNEDAQYQMPGAISFINDRKTLKAIIVCAQSNDYLMPAFENCTGHAYNTLLYQGYLKENIYFLGPDTSKDIDNNCKADDINTVPTISNLLESIDTWAIDAKELLIFMVGHGEDGAYLINTNEKLQADILDQHLDNLQNNTAIQSVLMIYDACYSESFAKYLKPPQDKYRLIITSAQKEAFFYNRGLKSFSFIFWSGIMIDGNVYNAFNIAREVFYCSDDETYCQKPSIDADGNGYPGETQDHQVLNNLNPVIGRAIAINPDIPVIEMISDTQELYGQTHAEIIAGNIQSNSDITGIWAYVNAIGEKTNDDRPLELKDDNNDGIYSGVYNDFVKKGTYDVTIYAVNTKGKYSFPKSTKVIQKVGMKCDFNGDHKISMTDILHLMNIISEMPFDEHN